LLACIDVDHQQMLHQLSVSTVATDFDLLGCRCCQAKVAFDVAAFKLASLVCC